MNVKAREIVEAHRPSGLPAEFQPVNMAKVLLVEDNPFWLGRYRGWAEKASHEVATATSPKKAEELLGEDNFDLVITGGMNDGWITVHNAAQAKGIRTVVVSDRVGLRKDVRKRGAEFVGQDILGWGDRLKEILGIDE